MSRVYYRKLLVEIITGNYQLVYYVVEKCGNYRATGVSKKANICPVIKTTAKPLKRVFHINFDFVARNFENLNYR